MEADPLTTRFTRVLDTCQDAGSLGDELSPIVYDQLRAIAQKRLMQERRDHTLQATALVHEALIRLRGDRNVSASQEAHYYGAAAEAMRRILIDHARRKATKKRNGIRVSRVPDVLDLANEADPGTILALDDALGTLEREDPRAAQVVKLRFYAGLEVEDVALAMNISPRTVAREWAFARTRLFQMLAPDES